jgi:hypothetical protein
MIKKLWLSNGQIRPKKNSLMRRYFIDIYDGFIENYDN